MTLNERIEEVKNNYNQLPKSDNDDGEFVIIAENNQGGGYEEYKDCLGVNEKGILTWSFLSGCSCRGTSDIAYATDVTAKTFKIKDAESVEGFYEEFKCEPTGSSYKSY